ncbi:MAG TPA: hypothetical protein VD772_03310 [Anseongella sp.]|nr:hypothetical protein [Anseongella sp.]
MSKFRVLTKILPLYCILLSSCGGGGSDGTADSPPPVEIYRFEKDFFALDTLQFNASLEALRGKAPLFFDTHFNNVFGIRPGDTSGYAPLKAALTNPYVRAIASDIDSVYPGMENLGAALADAFQRYRADFPKEALPSVFTYPACISGFQPAVWNADSLLAIGIDCFLGKDYYFYQTTGYPRYITRRFSPEHLVPTALKGFVQYRYPPDTEDPAFLSSIIYEGKVLYLLDRMLPGTPDSLKIGYTAAEMGWAETYERNIWAYFIERGLLYSADAQDYRKYLDEAPFTSDLGTQSAPRIGAFTGWRIVRKYMEENKEISLPALMAEKDAQKVLSRSKYKPK